MTDDELDRALFALPLAAPRAGLRDRVLLALDAPGTAPAATRTLVLGLADIVGAGILFALATWLVVSGIGGALVTLGAHAFASLLATPQLGVQSLFWAALGVVIAVVVGRPSLFDRPLRGS